MSENHVTLLQYIHEAKTPAEARQVFESLSQQYGWVGGRILPAAGGKALRVQAFFDAADHLQASMLPDGVRRVIVLRSQFKSMGIL